MTDPPIPSMSHWEMFHIPRATFQLPSHEARGEVTPSTTLHERQKTRASA
jgi:hypothetical protein